MRLTQAQKEIALQIRPAGAKLRRIGSHWAVIWFDGSRPPAERWNGDVVSRVDEGGRLWFTLQTACKTRREVDGELNVMTVTGDRFKRAAEKAAPHLGLKVAFSGPQPKKGRRKS